MKEIKKLTFYLIILCLILFSCASLKDAKLKDNPDFEMKSDKFEFTGPFSPVLGTNEYSLKNPELNQVYKMVLKLGLSSTTTNLLDEKYERKIHYTETEEITSHSFVVQNYMDSSKYEVEGELAYHKTIEEEGEETFEESERISLIEFIVLEDGNNIGKISIVPTDDDELDLDDDELEMVVTYDATLHDINYLIEYQNIFNKTSISIEKDFKLIALFALKPKSFVTTKFIGDVLIQQDLDKNIKADIFSIYLIIEGINKSLGSM